VATVVETVRSLAAPLVAEHGLELVDVEHTGGVLRLTVDRDGGAGLDLVAAATRAVSRALDAADPLPGQYTLEVSTPGLERPLRTPDHFARAIGRTVAVKTVPGTAGPRRLTGTLVAADADHVTVRVDPEPDADAAPGTATGDGGTTERTLRYDEIERARTTFAWGPAPKPGKGSTNKTKAS
jgi:ribosome maturation factor RimP